MDFIERVLGVSPLTDLDPSKPPFSLFFSSPSDRFSYLAGDTSGEDDPAG